jgi:hypothetical protein
MPNLWVHAVRLRGADIDKVIKQLQGVEKMGPHKYKDLIEAGLNIETIHQSGLHVGIANIANDDHRTFVFAVRITYVYLYYLYSYTSLLKYQALERDG